MSSLNFLQRAPKALQLAALLLLAFQQVSLAASILIGAPGDAPNFAPFGAGNITRYQQVYSASQFSGPIAISNITFFHLIPQCGVGQPGCTPASGDFGNTEYALSFSTTSRSVNALSTDLVSNVGPNQQLFFQGFVSGVVLIGGSFTFSGTPFQYDPAMGNLLLDIVPVSRGSSQFGPDAVFDVLTTGGTSGVFSRAFSQLGGATPDPDAAGFRYGLVTEFNVPEPGSFALVFMGGLLLFGRHRLSRFMR